MSETDLVKEQLAEALADTEAAAKDVAFAIETVTPYYPTYDDDFSAMRQADRLAADGFLYRYGSLVSLLQDKVFRFVAELEQEDVSRLTRRDLTSFMERIGVLRSATEFSQAAVFRNRLSHGSPRHDDKRGERFNEAVERAPSLIQTYNSCYRYVRDRRLVDVGVGAEVPEPETPTPVPLSGDDETGVPGP